MRKLFLAVVAALSAISAFAYEPRINDINIQVSLDTLGTAHITEVWDVVVASGTEWYLVRENLGDIRIRNLAVKDETGLDFLDEGSWDVDRSISQKAGRCGLHRTSGGYEICWGVGSYGPHVFTVSYEMTNAVKSLNDYDILHMQFVSDELSSCPEHVKLSLSAPVLLNKENSRIWGFGYEGTAVWNSGFVEVESSERFRKNSSMILLVRFDKGVFHSPSVREQDFQDVLDKALEGSHFEDEDNSDEEVDPLADFIATLFTGLVMWWVFVKPILRMFGIVKKKDRKRLKSLFGRRRLPSFPGWDRKIPFDGNYLRTYYIASHMKGNDDNKLTIVSALILRMIGKGNIKMKTNLEGKNEFTFDNGISREWMSKAEEGLYDMLVKASGQDKVLQPKEFKRWSFINSRVVADWVKDMKTEVRDSFSDPGLATHSSYYESIELTPAGQEKAMQALRFRQFLKEFTIINERHAPEVALWGDYLIVAALFGMADKVASDMKRLVPDIKVGDVRLPTNSLGDLVYFTSSFNNYARSANSYHSISSSGGGYSGGSSSGFGGGSSFGGGGGFSGGGHGGGSR